MTQPTTPSDPQESASTSRVKPPTKGHGSKYYLAPWIARYFPPRDQYLTFVDAMCRTCAVLLAHDPRDKAEVANDLDGRITNFWEVLQHPNLFAQLQRDLEATPFSEPRFREAVKRLASWPHYGPMPNVLAAADFFVLARQSMAGREEDFAPLTRTRLRRGMNEQVSAWLTAVDNLPLVHARMRRVLIRSTDVFKLDAELRNPRTFFYLDPPYHPSTRAVAGAYGNFDWTDQQHCQLLGMVRSSPSLYAISGYRCELYDQELASWNRHELVQPVHSGSGPSKRRAVECLWTNY